MTGQYESEDFVDNGQHLRRCSFCGQIKPIEEFAWNGGKRRTDCKTCYNIRRKENRGQKSFTNFVNGMKRRGEDLPELTFQEWKEVVIYFGGCCAYCGASPRKNEHLTKDHMIPVSLGGATTPDNIVPACAKCNSSKGNHELKEWFMKQDFFSQERLNKIFQWRSIQRMLISSRKGAMSYESNE